MNTTYHDQVLAEAILPQTGQAKLVKQIILVIAGVVALIVAAKTSIPLFPSPVPITLGTFAVLAIAVAYGPRLGLITIGVYTVLGALGFNVFANTTGFFNGPFEGVRYMLGGSGGYILGYILATVYLGWAAVRGADRGVETLFGALLVANVLIYVPGLLWLATWITMEGKLNLDAHAGLWSQTFAWGLTPYIIGDLIKLAIAGLLIPTIWKLVGDART
ncbi:MAG: biotin transporter BioY [Pseudomonadota bacterium]